MPLVTPELKDVVLRHLIDKIELGDWEKIYFKDRIENVWGDTLEAILVQFKNKGFISMKLANTVALVKIEIEAHDFIQRGGFYGYEVLFQSKVSKLLIELENLQAENPSPKNYDLLQTISGAVQSVATLYEIIKK